MKIAVIPARGGSKRIPLKNIRPFYGRPMITWSIAAALESDLFDHIIVSTDDVSIAEIARTAGATVPFLRPPELADDHTPTVPVIAHAIGEMQKSGIDPLEVCCIYATAPFVRSQDLMRGHEILRSSEAMFAFSATSFPFPVQRGMRLLASGRVEMLQPEHAMTRSQDLEETYHDAGQFYWGTASAWAAAKPLIGPNSAAVLLPRHRVQDIDTLEDWARAEALFEVLQKIGSAT